jgi:hypothetical protein
LICDFKRMAINKKGAIFGNFTAAFHGEVSVQLLPLFESQQKIKIALYFEIGRVNDEQAHRFVRKQP